MQCSEAFSELLEQTSQLLCDPALGPFGPECPGSVPESVPENGGVRRSVPRGVPGPFGPRAPECPESVPRVSLECQKGVSGDTLGTLSRHSGARGLKGPGDTPWDTPPDTPVFGDTPRDTRARRARETPVAGRQDCNNYSQNCKILLVRAALRMVHLA